MKTKECPRTISGKHKWGQLYIYKWSWKELAFLEIPVEKRCEYCGIYN